MEARRGVDAVTDKPRQRASCDPLPERTDFFMAGK
jgi:hypothetical protein